MLKRVMAVTALIVAQPLVAQAQSVGIASYYSDYYNGRLMANGQLFYNSSDSCAHRTLRFGTRIRITNIATGASTTCIVRDRMPNHPGRVIDLSKNTFLEISNLEQGLVRVSLSW
jgi:rare lipoprotein A